MELPTKIREVKSINPGSLLIYSNPKVGKTTIVSQLENNLIIELEPKGADYVSGLIVEASKPSEFNKILDEIEKANIKKGGFVYKYITIDTITALDEWSEITGTYRYMNKSQGQKFNRVGNIPKGTKILHTDPSFESVHEIPNGFGYKHSRDEMTDWFYRILKLAPHIIFLAHVKDKLIESKKTGDTIEIRDLNLTGKVKSIYCSKVDSVALLEKEDNKTYLNFANDNNTIAGGRCKHLEGKIYISEQDENKNIKTFWDKIYLK